MNKVMPDSEKIRVLIVDDIAETRENIRKLLQFEKNVEVVGTARTGREGIDLAQETKPDVVLMDINMPDMDGITATEAIRRKVPFAQMIILSVQSDPNYMRRAMLAGARDFLTKPPMVDELTAAIQRAAAMARDERSKSAPVFVPPGGAVGSTPAFTGPLTGLGKVIVVYSPKGGTGCTTLATNLAMLLHNEESPAVLVDTKLQFGDISVFLNEKVKNSIIDLIPRVDELDPEVVYEVLLTHEQSGVKILAAPQRPEEAEEVDSQQISKVLNYLSSLFSYVIVDTSSYLTEATLGALDAADVILLVTVQDIPSIKNSRLFLDLLDAMEIPRKRVLFVINRFDKRIGITAERVGESLKQPVVASIPFEERVVAAINRGIPVVAQEKGKAFTRGFLRLSKLVRERLTELEDEQAQQALNQ